jgi:uncharacterized membrane protein YfcA
VHNYPLLILLGLVLGAFGTLVGAGGGFILAPLLLLMYPGEGPDTITSISLFVVLFNALSGSWAYARMGRIDFRAGFLFALAGIPGAILGALTTTLLPRSVFNLIVGVVLIAGSMLLFLFPSERNGPHTMPPEAVGGECADSHRRRLRLGMILSTVVGYLSSLLGIGGGIIHVPMMVKLLGFPVHVATATSHFVLVFMALTATITHVVTGAFNHGIRRAAALAIGAIVGARIGAGLSTRIAAKPIMRALAIALGVVGIRLLFSAG